MNFNTFNSLFESKHKINKKEVKRVEKKSNPLIESLNKSKPLWERKWEIVIPGSYRKSALDAGEDEDYETFKQSLIDACNYVIDKSEDEDIIEAYEEYIEDIEYSDIEDEDDANYWLNELYDLLDNTNVFLGIDESLEEPLHEEKIVGGSMDKSDREILTSFINFVNSIEEKNKDDVYITWNFGRNMDGKMTGGVDLHSYKKDFDMSEQLDEFLSGLNSTGFELDASLGYDKNPWKESGIFGNSYHTQVIEIDDGLGEGLKKTSLPNDIKKDIDDIYKTHGGEIPKWQIQGIAQDFPKYSKDIWRYASELEESLNPLKESQCYPGFCDDDEFFTREEIDEFGEEVVEEFSKQTGEQFTIMDLFMDGRRRLVADVESEDGDMFSFDIMIDFRKIQKPSDIFKYKQIAVNQLVDEYNEYNDEFYNESLDYSDPMEDFKKYVAYYYYPGFDCGGLSDDEYYELEDTYYKERNRYNQSGKERPWANASLTEDTIKQKGKWVNKGKEGTHGKFKTKKQADAQRKAMFANNFKG